jgi:hypothetical protein
VGATDLRRGIGSAPKWTGVDRLNWQSSQCLAELHRLPGPMLRQGIVAVPEVAQLDVRIHLAMTHEEQPDRRKLHHVVALLMRPKAMAILRLATGSMPAPM